MSSVIHCVYEICAGNVNFYLMLVKQIMFTLNEARIRGTFNRVIL